MDIAGAVEEHVDGADLLRQRLDRGVVGDIEAARRDPRRLGELRELADIDVGGNHLGPFGGKGESRGAPDARPAAVTRAFLPASLPLIHFLPG